PLDGDAEFRASGEIGDAVAAFNGNPAEEIQFAGPALDRQGHGRFGELEDAVAIVVGQCAVPDLPAGVAGRLEPIGGAFRVAAGSGGDKCAVEVLTNRASAVDRIADIPRQRVNHNVGRAQAD